MPTRRFRSKMYTPCRFAPRACASKPSRGLVRKAFRKGYVVPKASFRQVPVVKDARFYKKK